MSIISYRLLIEICLINDKKIKKVFFLMRKLSFPSRFHYECILKAYQEGQLWDLFDQKFDQHSTSFLPKRLRLEDRTLAKIRNKTFASDFW